MFNFLRRKNKQTGGFRVRHKGTGEYGTCIEQVAETTEYFMLTINWDDGTQSKEYDYDVEVV